MRIRWITCAGMVALALGLQAYPALAEWHAGGGIEYFTTRISAEGSSGDSLRTLLQTTLAVAEVNWETPQYELGISGAISDWNASGSWQAAGVPEFSSEPFDWVRQHKFSGRGIYRFWETLGAGLCWQDHTVMHYQGLTQIPYMQFRVQSPDILLVYRPLKTPSVNVDIGVAYSPLAKIEFMQNIVFSDFINDNPLAFQTDAHGVGTRFGGEIRMQYLDSLGWGIEVYYQYYRAAYEFPEIYPALKMNYGSLMGHFIFRF